MEKFAGPNGEVIFYGRGGYVTVIKDGVVYKTREGIGAIRAANGQWTIDPSKLEAI